LENVTFRYGGQRGGIQDISLTLPAGSVTAIVGESGSGKSTLARVLLGLATPEYGRVLVDAHDLTTLDQARWRRRLAWVPQRPFFSAASIRENLLTSRADAGDRELLEALARAELVDVVTRLPQGLDTRLGDRGAGLSGGELRRLALARLMLRDPLLIVLDEPTAGLDQTNERLLLDAIDRLAPGRTVVVISHREETVRRCTRVVRMSGGQLLQPGNNALPQEVMP